jgi:hypothetical protein
VRNILLLLFWLIHYLPVRALAVLFQLSKSMINKILHQELNRIYLSMKETWISLDSWELTDAPMGFLRHVGVIDGTEVYIQTWQKICFSKKERMTNSQVPGGD